MDFEPLTSVYFCRTGIDDYNKVVCKSQEELFNTITKSGNVLGRMTECSFQRADGLYTIRVDHNAIYYYDLLKADTIIYKNTDTALAFWTVGNITGVEWKNPDCSFVTFKIDHFMTYQTFIDWPETYALVEREHIKEDWSSDGGNPLFSNMGPAEDFGTVADVPFYTWVKGYKPNQVVIASPYDAEGNAVFNGQERGNLYTSLQIDALSPGEANSRFSAIAEKKEASINNIVGVYGCPSEWVNLIKNGGFDSEASRMIILPAVNKAAQALPSMIEYNNAKCWSAPFTVIRLMSSSGQQIDFTPQWLGNDQDNYTVRVRAAGCGGMFAGAQCTFENKNGAFDWQAWNDFIVSITELPSCPWTGDGFTDWASVNMASTVWSTINSGVVKNTGNLFRQVSGLAGGRNGKSVLANGADLLTGAVETVGDYVEEGLALAAKINNQKAAGATVNGGGNFNSLVDVADEAWGFKIVYYSTQIYTMRSVDSYFDRFGYRVNRLKRLEIENRPIWTFVKTAECHIVSDGGIPYISEKAINGMFNHGATFWKNDQYMAGTRIGDYSKAHDNRGIKG